MKTTVILLTIFILVGCKSIHSTNEEKYNMLNDILSNSINEKQYLTCYCNEQINFNDVTRPFYSAKNDRMYRRELLSDSDEYLDENKTNWIFDNEDISYLKET